jgi:hypothetical protein
LRFSLPESPRWLATHGQGQRALDLLQRMGLSTVPLVSLQAGAASDTKSDPLGIVLLPGVPTPSGAGPDGVRTPLAVWRASCRQLYLFRCSMIAVGARCDPESSGSPGIRHRKVTEYPVAP